VSDAQSLSFGGGNSKDQSGGGDEVVPGHVHGAVQSTTQTLRTPVQRALQVPGGGWLGQRLSEDGVRLRPSESGAGEATEGRGIVEGI